ncbi:MAG: DUF1156 domain-containing protein [Candidatus Caldarchaeum sp.]
MEERIIESKSPELVGFWLEVSKEAKKEKVAAAVPPINKMLYWWTRKPLIVSRAVAAAATLPGKVCISHVKNLIGLNGDRRAYSTTVNAERYRRMVDLNADGLKVFDPFAGSGNLLFAVLELGLNCRGMDYNPVAYLIMKATLEYPAKFGPRLAEEVETYGNELIERTRTELERFYRRSGRSALHYLWVWCIRCPHCGQRVPLTNQMWLRRGVRKKTDVGYQIVSTEDGDFRVKVVYGIKPEEASRFTQKGGRAVCIRCGNAISYKQMTAGIAKDRDAEMIAVVVEGPRGKEYEEVTDEDKRAYMEAERELERRWESSIESDLIPMETLKESELYTLTNYGFRHWYEVFNARQLLVMTTLLRNIRSIVSEIRDAELAKAVATYLSFMLCKHVDYNCVSVLWHVTNEQIAHALSMRRPSMIYNFAETNPFERTSGSLHSSLSGVVNGIRYATRLTNVGARPEVVWGSALNPQLFPRREYDVIITDPPYLDDVPYGELSDFFYVWLYRALRGHYPELPPPTPIDEDLVLSGGRFGGDSRLALSFYESGLQNSFVNIYNALKDDGLLVVFFAHSSTEAWDLLLRVLRKARFRVVSSYAVHTEMETNVLASGKTSFMSSIVVTCRKILEEKEEYFESLAPKIESEVKSLLESFSDQDLLEVPITDLLIMAYGKVLEVATQYTKLKSYKADFRPDFETLVSSARDYIMRHLVHRLVGMSPNALGPLASFAVVAKVFYGGNIPADEALKLAKAFGLDLDSLTRTYLKKAKGSVEILHFDEVKLPESPDDLDKSDLYHQLLFLLSYATRNGAARVKPLLSHPNMRVDDLRALIGLLLKSYQLRQNRGEKFSEKELEEFNLLRTLHDVIPGQSPGRGASTLDRYLEGGIP